MLEKMKQCINFRSSCMSDCCINTEIDLDLNNGKDDVHISVHNAKIEIEFTDSPKHNK